MKVIRIIVGFLLIVVVILPQLYEFTLPSVNKQQATFQALVEDIHLNDKEGVKFNKVIKTKLYFSYLYRYDSERYTKLDIKNFLFMKLDEKGWKVKMSGRMPDGSLYLFMESDDYLSHIDISDETFMVSFKYKELYE